jgi:tetratricopeptide (TPR) repeat protein
MRNLCVALLMAVCLEVAAAPPATTPPPVGAPAVANPRIAALVSALETFDTTVNKVDQAAAGEAAGKLLAALRSNADGHPSLPTFTDAVRGAAVGMAVSAGLKPFYELLLEAGVDDARLLISRLKPPNADLIRPYIRLRKQAADLAIARADLSGVTAELAALTAKWKTRPRGGRDKAKSTELDVHRVYERALTGDHGATADLYLAHAFGATVPVDQELSGFWGAIYGFLGGQVEGVLTPEYLDRLLADGSAIAQFLVADGRSRTVEPTKISQTDMTLIEKSAAGGYRPAAIRLASIRTALQNPKTREEASAALLEAEALEALRRGDLASANTWLRAALSHLPGDPGLLVLQARLRAHGGGAAEAEKDLIALSAAHPTLDAALGLRAALRAVRGDWAGARETANAALRLNPSQPDALLALARADMAQGRLTEAITTLARNIAANPDYDDGRLLYGMALADSGQIARGVQELETLCERNPYATHARERLIVYYAQQEGQSEQAWRHVRRMEELRLPQAAQARAELHKLLAARQAAAPAKPK